MEPIQGFLGEGLKTKNNDCQRRKLGEPSDLP
jgi:hypothetical protein